ncbi:hypothetical protein [Pontibacter ruber]|uniref:STAS/SEC14 domain-containing protein n=1 Tax=Pontibacter ruber TaxID=1343895 RepID=A0ABW5CSL0_9BACT|nr:hypothetical protein [Pontibacter ruber]
MNNVTEILYEDELIKLEFTTQQDILLVAPQNQSKFGVSEIRKAFMSTVACTREHDIKRLLLDFSRNIIEMNEAEYKNVIAQLTVGLMPTHIKKVARIATSDTLRELKVEATYDAIRKAVELPLEFRNFPSTAEAMEWLLMPSE